MKKNLEYLVNNSNINWLVDLDNTLYCPNDKVFSILDKRIEYYLSYKCRCNLVNAAKIRKELFEKHKNTFSGSLKEKIIDKQEMDEFISFAHDFKVEGFVTQNKKIIDFLSLVKGRKFLFSNATKKYIKNILLALNLNNFFEKIFSIEDYKYSFKPNIEPYLYVIKYLNTRVQKVVFIDDMPINLSSAKKLRMSAFHTMEIEKFMDGKYAQ